MSEHIGLEGSFEWNLVVLDLCKCKIKIAPVEFYIRCFFIFILRQYRVSLSPFIYSAVA